MKNFMCYLVGSFAIGVVIALVLGEIFRAGVYVVPAMFVVIPLIGIINHYVKKANIRLIRNKFISGAINKFTKSILLNSGLWISIGVGFLFNIDLLLSYVADILKFGTITFIATNIVWAAIRFVVMKVSGTNNVPKYSQLWYLGY